MDRRNFMQKCACSLGAAGVAGGVFARADNAPSNAPGKMNQSNKPNARPNIVFILADDMGYGDIQAYNPESKIPTPNLNRLAGEGVRFTDAHSGAAVCTPTRYGLLTGRYCWRTRLKSGVLFPPNDKPLIDRDRLTLAGMLKQHGYHSACIGKWHLGMEWGRREGDENQVDFNKPIQYGPTDTGFDEFFGIAGSLDMIPYAFYRNHTAVQQVVETQPALKFPRFVRQGPRANGFDPGRVLDELTNQAVDYIHRRAGESNPFFLYFPMTAPHKPVWPADRFRGKTGLGPYGDFVAQVDWTVGQVLQALEEAGAADNTLVMYSSDNGSYMHRLSQDKPDHVQDSGVQGFHPSNHRPNGPWRGTKADIWEAGHRVPLLVRWPGRAKPGAQCDQTVCLTDIFSTYSELVGFAMPKQTGEDSFSLLPLIEGKAERILRAPVIHHSVSGMFSLRDGKWKMVFGDGSGGREKPAGKPFREPYSLFDLESDPQETTNVIEKHPEIAELLQEKLEAIMNSGRSR